MAQHSSWLVPLEVILKGELGKWATRAPMRLWARVRNHRGPRAEAHEEFFPSSATCQIPNLSFMFETFIGRVSNGYFVEVGAYDGIFVSNSWGLATRGWHGLMMEPMGAAHDACTHNHKGHPGVKVIHTAIGPPGTETITLHRAGALTTANEDLATEYAEVSWSANHLTNQTESVPCTTLDAILVAEGAPRGFEVLIVDVEGYEEFVFSGFHIEMWRPILIIVELADMHPDLTSTQRADARLCRQIQNSGYQIVYKDQVNTVFARIDRWESAMGTESA
jgi:FkbM family methyltransferase